MILFPQSSAAARTQAVAPATPPAAAPPAPGPYTRHMHRLIAVFAAIATTVMSGFTTASIRAMVQVSGQWAFWLLLPALVLPALVAGIAAAIGILRFMRRKDGDEGMAPERPRRIEAADRIWRRTLLVHLTFYTTFVVLTALLPIIPFYNQIQNPVPVPNLLVNYYFVIAAVVTAVLSPRVRFLYIGLLAPFLIAGYPAQDGLRLPVEEVMSYTAFALADMGLLTWLLRQAQALDEADARRRALLIRLRIDASRTRARRRTDNFIHDHILSVLKTVPATPAGVAQLRAGAREALADLSTAADESDAPARPSELLAALTRRLRAIGGDDVVICDSITQDFDLPPEAARALIDAAAEALRNSLAHAAGPDQEGRIARTAMLRSDADGVTVTVSDDGRGFDPEHTGTIRHGVSGSIIARMRDAGGEARIDSSPGAGTTVTLSWSAPTATTTTGTSPLSLASCLETPEAQTIVVCIFILYVLITLLEVRAGSYRHLAPVIAGLLAIGLAALALLKRRPGYSLPARTAALVAAAAGVADALIIFQIDFAGWPSYTSWCIGASSVLCCGLIVRERPRQAWAGLLLIITVIGVWTLATGRNPITIFALGSGQFSTLLIWHSTARISIAITARTAASEAAGAEITARRRAHQESETLMRQAMASVRRRVGPLLTAIAEGAPITAGMRTRARMLEVELRDERRAPFFTDTRVIESARAARTRGIDVILLDDRGTGDDLTHEAQKAVIDRASQALDDARAGQVVIRLLPPHQRPGLLSIVTDDDILTLDETGELV